MDVKISILMAVYNSELFLSTAVESVINQTFTDWELICVNDGSTDSSEEILERYSQQDNRISHYTIPNSGRASVPRNYALKKSVGSYTFQLDSDDYISPELLENTYNKAIESGAECVLPDLCVEYPFSSDRNRYWRGFDGNYDVILSNKDAVVHSLIWKIQGIGLFDGNLMRSIGYDETGMNGDEYTTRLFFLKSNFVAFAKGCYHYIQHESSITHKVSPKHFDYLVTSIRLTNLLVDNDFPKHDIFRYCYDSCFTFIGLYKKRIKTWPQFSRTDRLLIESKLRDSYKLLNKNLCRESIQFVSPKLPHKILLNFMLMGFYPYSLVSLFFHCIDCIKRVKE